MTDNEYIAKILELKMAEPELVHLQQLVDELKMDIETEEAKRNGKTYMLKASE